MDDSPVALDLQSRLVRSRRYRVDQADNGIEALMALRNGDKLLLVSDVEMPELDGIGLIRSLRRIHASRPCR